MVKKRRLEQCCEGIAGLEPGAVQAMGQLDGSGRAA